MGIKEIIGIKIKGANFVNESELRFFSEKNGKGYGLVYGKNGAGKSTISRCFSKLSGNEEEVIEVSQLIDKEGNEIILSNEEQKSIFVFNEDFVDKNVKLNKDATGLETIVVLGEKIEIQEKLEAAEKEYEKSNKAYIAQEEVLSKYLNPKDNESPLYWVETIKKKLKDKDGWAHREQDIKGHSRATNVNDNTYLDIMAQKKPTKTDLELRSDYSDKFKELNDARSGKKRIDKEVDTKIKLVFDKSKNIDLLAKKIEKPVLSDREKYLLILQKEYGAHHTEDIKKILEPTSVDRCPFCLQEISEPYKKDLFKSIQNILSKEADDHKKVLSGLLLTQVMFDDIDYKTELTTFVNKVNSKLNELNDAIAEWNNLVEKKINDVYTPITKVTTNIDILLDDYINTLEELETARVAHNNSVADTKSLETELQNINKGIAYYEIKSDYNSLMNSKNKEQNEKNKRDVLFKAKENDYNTVQKYMQKKKDIIIASNDINDGLKYIFLDKNRLTIEASGDEYILKSRGKTVSPSKVSVGERNAVALCYFFSSILRGQKEEDFYKKECMLIIDDPVSSFDKDNRIGIISYLKKEINRFRLGNSNTKVLILTHDLQTTFDLHHMFKDMEEKCNTYELQNCNIINLNLEKKNEYSQLLQEVYLFARGENVGFDISVGNALRRVLEAYSTFNYRKGMEQLSCVPEIIKPLGAFSEHYENFMYRLMLNGESHSCERIKSQNSLDFFSDLSKEEKSQTVKEVLCFLYMLNRYHVLQHLQDLKNYDIEGDFDTWINDIADKYGIKK